MTLTQLWSAVWRRALGPRGWVLWLSLLHALPAQAALGEGLGPSFYKPLRLGACAGMNPDCILAGLKAELVLGALGFTYSTMLFTNAGTVKIYPLQVRHEKRLSWRPYLFGGGGGTFDGLSYVGGGLGSDLHFLRSRRLMLQPSVSIMLGEKYGLPRVGPGLGLSLMVSL